MLEAPVEKRLKDRLQGRGFQVLKLTTPGTAGTMDRLILRPLWSPGPPWFVEIKRPRKVERLLQEIVRNNWRLRGVLVLPVVDTYDAVDELCDHVLSVCEGERIR